MALERATDPQGAQHSDDLMEVDASVTLPTVEPFNGQYIALVIGGTTVSPSLGERRALRFLVNVSSGKQSQNSAHEPSHTANDGYIDGNST